MMMSSGSDLLSARASFIWIAALCAVLVFHCRHLIHLRGERRWYHSAHVVMLLGMLYMYASVAFGWDWFPARIWMILYVTTSAAIIGWIVVRYMRRRSFGYLWILGLAQQAAMIYMWVPMPDWVPRLTYAFVMYFALETIVWLARASTKVWAGGAVAGASGSMVMPPAPQSALGDICMTIMAASMAYMFAGMQLMMSMPSQSQHVAQQQPPAPLQSTGGRGSFESGGRASAQMPKIAANEPTTPAGKISPSALAGSYTIAAGDTLRGIAARLYGDTRQWHSIMKANPGLDPRRLHIGQVINLPMVPLPR